MADAKRRKMTLKANMIRNGWKFDGLIGTFNELTVELKMDGWEMHHKKKLIGSSEYGPTQMKDLKTAAASVDGSFEPSPRSEGKKQPLTEEQKEKRKQYAKNRNSMKRFQKSVLDAGFSEKTAGVYGLDEDKEVELIMGQTEFELKRKGKKLLAGNYIANTVQSIMDKLQAPTK